MKSRKQSHSKQRTNSSQMLKENVVASQEEEVQRHLTVDEMLKENTSSAIFVQ